MNLVELQQELRKMEAQLAGLSDEIENMKPQNTSADETEYERISRAAARHPIEIKELCQASDFQQSLYLKLLSYLIYLDCSEPLPAVQHLSRIGAGLNPEKYTTAYLMQIGLQVTPQELAEVVSALELVSDYFLVDALLLLNLGQGLTAKSAALIAGWLGDWHYSAVDRQVLAQIAKAFLTQDFDQLLDIPIEDAKRWQGKFGHYIPREWIKKKRIEIKIDENRDIIEETYYTSGAEFVIEMMKSEPEQLIKKGRSRIKKYSISPYKWYDPSSWERTRENVSSSYTEITSPQNGIFYYTLNGGCIVSYFEGNIKERTKNSFTKKEIKKFLGEE